MSPTLEDRLRATMRAHVPTAPPPEEQWDEIVAAGSRARDRRRRTRSTTTLLALLGTAALVVATLVVVRSRDAQQRTELNTASPGVTTSPEPPTTDTAVGTAIDSVMGAALDLTEALDREGRMTVTPTGSAASPVPSPDARAATDAAAARLRAAVADAAMPDSDGLSAWRDRMESRLRNLVVLRASDDHGGNSGREQYARTAADVAAIGFALVPASPTGRAAVDLAAVTGLAVDTVDTGGVATTASGATPLFDLFASEAQRREAEGTMAALPGDGASTPWLAQRWSLVRRLLAAIDWAPITGGPDTDPALLAVARAGADLEVGLAHRALDATDAPDAAELGDLATAWRARVDGVDHPDAATMLGSSAEEAVSLLRGPRATAPVEALAAVVRTDATLARLATTGAVARRLLVTHLVERDLAATTGLAEQVLSSWTDLSAVTGPAEGGSPTAVPEAQLAVIALALDQLLTADEGAARRSADATGFADAQAQLRRAGAQAAPPTVTEAAYRDDALRAVGAGRSLIDRMTR